MALGKHFCFPVRISLLNALAVDVSNLAAPRRHLPNIGSLSLTFEMGIFFC